MAPYHGNVPALILKPKYNSFLLSILKAGNY